VFSANPQTIVTADNFDKAMPRPEKLGEGGDFWLTRLFQGEGFYGNPSDKMIILKNGVEVHEVPIEQLNQETVIGRHPEAHIQLEAYKLGLFHIVFARRTTDFMSRRSTRITERSSIERRSRPGSLSCCGTVRWSTYRDTGYAFA
jgi:hypothetical protein